MQAVNNNNYHLPAAFLYSSQLSAQQGHHNVAPKPQNPIQSFISDKINHRQTNYSKSWFSESFNRHSRRYLSLVPAANALPYWLSSRHSALTEPPPELCRCATLTQFDTSSFQILIVPSLEAEYSVYSSLSVSNALIQSWWAGATCGYFSMCYSVSQLRRFLSREPLTSVSSTHASDVMLSKWGGYSAGPFSSL